MSIGQIFLHGVTEIRLKPIERSEANCGDGKPFYHCQEIVVKFDDATESRFSCFFAKAVSDMMEMDNGRR